MAFMMGALRAPSLNDLSCASMYPARCAAKLGIASLTLTPAAPWHAAHTFATLALPASTSAARAMGRTARRTDGASHFFMEAPARCENGCRPDLTVSRRRGRTRSGTHLRAAQEVPHNGRV